MQARVGKNASQQRWRHRWNNAEHQLVTRMGDQALDGVVVALSLAILGVLATTVVQRIAFPYSIEWMEGILVDHVARVLEGKRLYVPPSVSFVPLIYSPLFYWVSASVAGVVGLGYLPLRIVSVVAGAATMVCIMLFVRREGGSWSAAIAGAGLYAGTYQLSDSFLDLARVDSLSVCLLLWTAFLVRFGNGWRSAVGAALLLTLTYLTKQSLLALVAPMVLYLLWVDRWRAIWFVLSTVGMVAAVDLTLQAVSDGWYWYYTHSVAKGHTLAWEKIETYLRDEMFAPLALAYAVMLWMLVAPGALARRGGQLFYGLLVAALFGIVLMTRVHSFSHFNVFMPLHGGLAVVFGVALHAARAGFGKADERQPGARTAIHKTVAAAAAMQLALLWWNPEPYIPTRADRDAGDAWVAKVSALDGSVWVGHRGHMGALAGKERHATMMAMVDVIRSKEDYRNAKATLYKDVQRAITEQQFDHIIMDDQRFWFVSTLMRHYERDGVSWFRDRGEMMPRAGSRVRPEYGYRKKERKADCDLVVGSATVSTGVEKHSRDRRR